MEQARDGGCEIAFEEGGRGPEKLDLTACVPYSRLTSRRVDLPTETLELLIGGLLECRTCRGPAVERCPTSAASSCSPLDHPNDGTWKVSDPRYRGSVPPLCTLNIARQGNQRVDGDPLVGGCRAYCTTSRCFATGSAPTSRVTSWCGTGVHFEAACGFEQKCLRRARRRPSLPHRPGVIPVSSDMPDHKKYNTRCSDRAVRRPCTGEGFPRGTASPRFATAQSLCPSH